MEYIMKPIKDLKLYEKNSRTHSKEQIEKLRMSLREFGFINPVLIDEEDGVIAGHGRIKAAELEGYTVVPCLLVDYLTEAQKRAYIIADNRLAEDADWDEKMLREELLALEEEEYDLILTGFERDEIDKILEEEEEEDVMTNLDDVPQVSSENWTKEGDIWELGKHRIICGDAVEADTYARLLQGEKVNLVCTDPPYNVDYQRLPDYEGHSNKNPNMNIKNDAMSDADFEKFLLSAFTNMREAMSRDASIYVFHSNLKSEIFLRTFREAGFELENVCIWVKNNFTLSKKDYQWKHEPILYGFIDGRSRKWYGARTQSTVWEFDHYDRDKRHPTSKPVEVIAYMLRNSTMTNSIVLDPFLGSGSTLIACEEDNRICRGIELDPKFVDVVVRRYVKIYGDEQVFRNGKAFKEILGGD